VNWSWRTYEMYSVSFLNRVWHSQCCFCFSISSWSSPASHMLSRTPYPRSHRLRAAPSTSPRCVRPARPAAPRASLARSIKDPCEGGGHLPCREPMRAPTGGPKARLAWACARTPAVSCASELLSFLIQWPGERSARSNTGGSSMRDTTDPIRVRNIFKVARAACACNRLTWQ